MNNAVPEEIDSDRDLNEDIAEERKEIDNQKYRYTFSFFLFRFIDFVSVRFLIFIF